MKTFKNFVSEGYYSKDISGAYTPYTTSDLDELVTYLKTIPTAKKSMELTATGELTPIYRGMRGMAKDAAIYIGDGNIMDRSSSNTKNYYNIILSQVIPSWKPYPRRDKSFICATEESKSGAYGVNYRVVPLELQKIGICPEDDMWDSFVQLEMLGFGSLPSINSFLDTIVKITQQVVMPNDLKVNTMMEFLNIAFEKTKANPQDVIDEIDAYYDSYQKAVKEMIKFDSITAYLDIILNPEKNGFTLKSYPEFSGVSPYKEVWVSEKVLFIVNQFFDNTFEKILSKL